MRAANLFDQLHASSGNTYQRSRLYESAVKESLGSRILTLFKNNTI